MEHKHTPEEPDEIDARECAGCGGAGLVTRYRKVTHQLGSDEPPFWEECEACGGVGFCGPDSDRATAAKATGSQP